MWFVLKKIKLDCTNDSVLRSVGGKKIQNWKVLNAIGSSGSIITGLKSHEWQKIDMNISRLSLSVMLESVNKDFKWVITNIYGLHTNEERQILWQELKQFIL